MRILIVSQFFYPEPNSPRGLEFAKELKSRGHEVTAVTAYPNYPDGKLYKGYNQKIYRREQVEGIDLIRLPLYIDHSKSSFRRFLSYSSFALGLIIILPFRLQGKFDILFSYCPPITVPFVSWVISKMYKSRLFIDIQDFWPDTLSSAAGQNEHSLLFKTISKFSYFTYKQARHISVISAGFKNKLIKKGFSAEKISVIHNWSTAKENSVDLNSINKLREQYGFENKFVVLFAGNIGQAQALDHIIPVFKKIKTIDKEIVMYIFGSGVDKQRLVKKAKKEQITNVVFKDRVSLKEINKIQVAADVLFLHLKKNRLFEITIPSKLSGYMMLGKPIIGGLQGDAKSLLEASGGGITYEPENQNELFSAIMEIRNKSQFELSKMGEMGKEYYTSEISKKVGVDKFEQKFKSLI